MCQVLLTISSRIFSIFFVIIIQHTYSHSDYYEIVKNQLINEHSAPTNALFERLLQGGQVDRWTTVFGECLPLIINLPLFFVYCFNY